MRKRSLLLLGLIALISSALSFFMLTRGHVWLDDFASYLMQAKSILSWSMGDFIRRNAFTVQNSSYPPGPVAYPWGFPLLLALVYAIFGLNALALKLVGIAFYAVFLVAFYFLAHTRLEEDESLLLPGVFAVLPALLAANDLIISDIPFLAFSTISLFLADRFPRQKALAGILLGASLFMACFVRTTGVVLLAPLALTLLIAFWPRWQLALKQAAVPALMFGFLIAVQVALFPGGQDSYFSHFSMLTPQRLLDNALYYLWLPSWTFANIPGGLVLYPLLAVFVLVSLLTHLRRDAALHAYSLLTVALFIVWPERQGLRFIYPILPILFIAAFDGMKLGVARLPVNGQKTAKSIVSGFWGLLLLVSLGISAYSAYTNASGGRNINGPFDVYSNQFFSFIREETPAESVIIFMRPRALRLFTDRDAFMTERCDDLVKGDYVAIHEKMAGNGQIPPEQITSCNPRVTLEEVFNNKRFTVYKIQK
ncbi:MAG: glycosyltransferase family 39 protein [Chloroflexi bacterium]|nr:glycosyltransferase family 39 protein [Chloroflexota bacterium]